ncbi:uncharacterized protein SPPG_07932 [Spizellomyces punctatus DAOM BR117]|uniref:UBA/TS-N domain-containing protein n=1 Tax=Spizellomyces punctatus (strain DAOM BR117) TaxID=645134 RepID=A0A0L0H7Q6_SPIPD|nr:uncharacterized protein SPPG_07932 [Spizellomyces punctatus DAOM BR117]KNC96723.1 hypothetical protein SPPG_07932 [Spizellomyces punctatus DAOM BR117]|eukprot:XP_016604763.1 hypothetical protein SPPG_07932 [Spizellomyces punctatus DAOM BR117]
MADTKRNSWAFLESDLSAVPSTQSNATLATTTHGASKDVSPGFPLTAEETAAYAQLFKLADSQATGTVQPNDAVAFMSKSHLPQNVLSEIWQIADSERKGYLTQQGFYKALKLIALAQAGKAPSAALLNTSAPIPTFGGITLPGNASPSTPSPFPSTVASHLTGASASGSPLSAVATHRTGGSITTHHTGGGLSVHSTGTGRIASHMTGSGVASHSTGNGGAYNISAEERERFTVAFNSCKPLDGFVTGEAAKELFIKSTLPVDVLSKIWNLVDTSGAGKLDIHQFSAAMLLITRLRQGALPSVPATLPSHLLGATTTLPNLDSPSISPIKDLGLHTPLAPPLSSRLLNRMSTVGPPPSSPRIDRRRTIISTVASQIMTSPEWLIKDDEKAQCDQFFDGLDKDKKGFVTGQDSYEFFTRAKLPQTELARIWDLADISRTGRLSKDEFAVAMHLIKLRMAGTPLPSVLPPELVPPSLRMQALKALGTGDNTSGLAASPSVGSQLSAGETDLMGGMGSAPRSLIDARSLSFSKLPSTQNAAELAEREEELAQRKADLQSVEQQLGSVQPSVEELRQKRAALDSEFRTVTEKRNEQALQLSQLRAVYETESQIALETENALIREKQMLNIALAELQQAQQTVAALQAEKGNLVEQLGRTQHDIEEMKKQIKEANEASIPLRQEIEKLRADLKQHQQHREINEQVLQSARADYQQIHADLQQEQARLEQEKSRNAQVAQQISVQTAINEREREKMRAAAAQREKELAVSQSLPALNVTTRDPYAAFSSVSSPSSTMSPGKSLDTTSAKGSLMDLGSSVALNSPTFSTGSLSGTGKKAPPPPPPMSKKPLRGDPVGLSQTDLTHVPAPKPNESLTPVKPEASTASPASQSPQRKMSTTSISSRKSAKEELDDLLEIHQPKNKKSQSSLASFGPSPVSMRPASPSPVGPSPAARQLKPASVKSLTLSASGERPPEEEVFGSQNAKKSSSVRSLPLGESQETEKGDNKMASTTSALDFASAFGDLPTSTAPPATAPPPAPVRTDSATFGESNDLPVTTAPTEFNDAFSSIAREQIGGFASNEFEADFDSAFAVPPINQPQPVSSPLSQEGRKGSSSSFQDGASMRSTSTRQGELLASLATVNIEEEMKNAFAASAKRESNPQGNGKAETADFDDKAFGAVSAADFDDDAFKFDASFDAGAANFTSGDDAVGAFAGGSATSATAASFEADFANAFGAPPAAGGDPFSANNFSFGPPAQSPASFADLDAAFGSPSESNGTSDGKAKVNGNGFNAFDDAFGNSGDFGNAFTAAAPASPKKRPVPLPPQRASTSQDDAVEVQQIIALGFSKEEAVNALEVNAFDVAKATNYLLDSR